MASYDEILSSMYDTYTELTGVSPDDASDIAVRFKALAMQLAVLSGEVTALSTQVFPATATGEYLDMHAAARGISRKGGSRAAGVLTFSREHAAAYDIAIPAGTICQTAGESPVHFSTDAAALLPANTLTVDVAATAESAGSSGNILPGQATSMVNPPSGITGVTNRAAFSGGSDTESDAALSRRLSDGFLRVNNGADAGFYLDIALGYPGIAHAAVIPAARGSNTVDVVVYGQNAAPTAATLAGLQAEIDLKRPLGVDVLARTATAVPVAVTVQVAPGTDFATSTALDDAQTAIGSYIAGLGIGAPLLVSPLAAAILGCETVVNCHISAPSVDTYILDDRIISPGAVSVTQLEVS